MVMWSGSDPTAWMERYNDEVLQEKYAFINPGVEVSRSTGAVVISFPQFEGATNIKPEIFMLQGVRMRIVVSFSIIDADQDMSLGSPGSIQTISEQVIHLLGIDTDDTENGILEGKLQDQFRVYIPSWLGSTSAYWNCILEEISLNQPVESPVEITGTARFLWGGNPLE